jgi:hypothetical protein
MYVYVRKYSSKYVLTSTYIPNVTHSYFCEMRCLIYPSTGTYTNLGDLQRDLRGLSPTPPKKVCYNSNLTDIQLVITTYVVI